MLHSSAIQETIVASRAVQVVIGMLRKAPGNRAAVVIAAFLASLAKVPQLGPIIKQSGAIKVTERCIAA